MLDWREEGGLVRGARLRWLAYGLPLRDASQRLARARLGDQLSAVQLRQVSP